MALAWTCSIGSMQAQQVTVSPLPQNISWGSKAFDQGFSYTLTGEQDADADAVRVLKNKLKTGNGANVNIIIGERGDAAVKAYETNIPNKKEGYYLKVENDKVIIAGNDESGTFYGVQTFLQIASQPEVMQATVTDYPDVIDRGVVEGFYGNPWSTTDRKRQFEFYGENKMNVYIYGPKDDPYHRAQWREPYPAAEAAVLKELIQSAHENKVQFVWALHPGNDIKWNDTDRQNVVKKLELMYEMGVRAFSLFFDDIGGEGTDPTNQANLINYVTENFIKAHPELPPLIFCPTQYNRSWSSGDYLNILGSKSDKDARIMWTGNSVVDMINKSDMDWINAQIQRNAYIWLNYPTNDYCIDRMLMGPTYGNDKNIAEQLSGFTANPSEYAEASKVSLYSIADYTWNMENYDENASWERAIKYLMPDHAAAFKVFCENNIDLGSTYHGLRREGESKRFAEAIKVFQEATANGFNKEAFDAIKPMFDEFVNSCNELLDPQVQENDPLAKELVAWFQVMKLIGERGQKMCSLYASIADNKPEEFINTYKEMVQLEAEQKAIRSRDFEGSIKSPNPTVAAEVVAPFMKQYTNLLIAEYKKHYTDGWENFPAVLLNDGKYYIKYNGKFLTNVSGSKYPTFVANEDDINPQRQEWVISMDYSTNRYKIVNAQDNRYLNEKGEFTVNETTNPYESAWHSYNITRLNGKYAIQNAGSAGDKYWTANATRVSTGSVSAYNPDNFIFELVPLDEEAITYPVIVSGGSYHIINPTDGSYLTNNTGNNNPKFEAKKEKDPQNTQSWTFTLVPATGRYKIVSAADNRNLNEMGQFGTAYDDNWNTFKMQELGGLFFIQCAGSAGNNFWSIENNAISKGNKTEGESYIFKIDQAPEAPMDEEATLVFYKQGLVTDPNQIADGDYVVLQNVNTGNANRQGYLYYQDDTKFLTFLAGYYQTELTDMKSAFPDKYVFQVEKNAQGLSFKNVTAKKYIPNNVASGAYAPTENADNSKFTLEASAQVSMAWNIKSAANGKYINGEPGYPVVWSDGHPIKIYKVAESAAPADVEGNGWFRIQTTDGQSGLRMQLGDADGEELVWMKGMTGAAGDEALWSLQESPEVAGRYALVNKKNDKGSVNWQNDKTHEALINQFDYSQDHKDFGIYVKTQTTEVLPSWVMYRINGGNSVMRFLNHQGAYLKEAEDPSQTGKLWKMIPAASLELTANGYAVGAFSAPIATIVPQNVWVYAATASTDQEVTLSRLEGKILPANTPVLLVANNAGNYEMSPTTGTDQVITPGTNLLKSTTSGKILAPAQSMTLSISDEEACMAPVTAGSPLKGYSVYLPQNGQSVKKALVFDELPPVTGILSPEETASQGNGKIYDLSGREVSKPTKGVYIRNGQKFIVNQ